MQPRRINSALARPAAVLLLLAGAPLPGFAAPGCVATLGAPAFESAPLVTRGTTPALAELPLNGGRTYLIEVSEDSNDALVEILDAAHAVAARADHPERRSGVRRVLLSAATAPYVLRVTGKEDAAISGTARARAYELGAPGSRPECTGALRDLAAADADYALGGEILHGRAAASGPGAHPTFLKADAEYAKAEAEFKLAGDERLRGETQLALAALAYQDLPDYQQAASWAQAAAETLAGADAYRAARAEELRAGAWLEMVWAGHPATTAGDEPSNELLRRARAELDRLAQFHLRRGERYDAALQINNYAISYYNDGDFTECFAAEQRAIRIFDEIHEPVRGTQARQNAALCLWGLGQLPAARRWLAEAAMQVGPDPYPSLYVAVLTNTAIADYALGRIDESLELYDRALAFANKIQSPRDQAYCLDGIGHDYYALGDRARARDFLARALALRTPALDGRGRLLSLRALANIDAEEGHLDSALGFDREALGLSVAGGTRERLLAQLAAHLAMAGLLGEAQQQLNELLTPGGGALNPLARAEAHLQRALVARRLNRPQDALEDLKLARVEFLRFQDVRSVFTVDLESARARRSLGEPEAAYAAVGQALAHADAVRLQSANPEFRAQLLVPLRAAYDLKLDLLRERFEAASAAGHTAAAAQLAELAFHSGDGARARSFADLGAQRVVVAKLAPLLQRREELYQELAGRRFALAAHVQASGLQDERTRHLLSDIAELGRQIDTLNTRLAAQAGGAGPHAARAGMPAVPPGSALVSYWLGAEFAYAWVVLPDRLQWVSLGPSRAIRERAVAFHDALTRLVDTSRDVRIATGRALYALVIQPLAPLLAGARHWAIIPDGALDYVSFAALPDAGGEYVVTRHDVVLAPAAWMLTASAPAAAPARSLLLVADPVYEASDPRLTSLAVAAPGAAAGAPESPPTGELHRLPFSGEEATRIAAQFPSGAVDQLVGLKATRAELLTLDWSQYRYIHIAAHGIVDAEVPQLSALILGRYDARGQQVPDAVRVADLALQRLNADVVVYSACDTALGKEIPSEGLVGIAYTTLARGAHQVVGSLWPVPDEMGAQVMTEFYRHLLKDSVNAPAALAAAMREVLARDPQADPALWGAFQISSTTLAPAPGAAHGAQPPDGQRRLRE